MKLSFRTMLLTVLLFLVLTTVISLSVSGYVTSHATASDLTLKVLDQASLVIDVKVRGLLSNANHVGDCTRRLADLRVIKPDDQVGFVQVLRALMEASPELTGAFLGTEPFGECVGLSRLPGNQLIVWELRKNPSTDKLEIREYEPDAYPANPFEVDLNGDAADTRRRPWYVAARTAGRQTWSAVYPFFLSHGVATVPGITCATPLYKKDGSLFGVFGVDIRLNQLCSFLRTLHVGENGFPFVVEVHPDGTRTVIAHPDEVLLLRPASDPNAIGGQELVRPEDINDGRVTAFMGRVPPHLDPAGPPVSKAVRFVDGPTPYLGSYRLLVGDDLPPWLLCTVVPEAEVLQRAEFERRIFVLLGGIVLLAAVLISLLVSRNLSRSLVRLVQETEEVGQFHVEASKPVPSMLLEVEQLARATEQMKTSLRSFGKFVPTDLVRRLLAEGIEARPGGEDRVLTIFFCDLASFTTISEGLSPQDLVEQLGEYFTAFAEEVAATGGTVDKFIGDAVMAFWGAPTERPDHASAACRCALNCQRRLAELRESWKARGKPLFYARIGINTGPVVVGNIGSALRLNYTVIGDAVNVASRLEGLNKYYGTSICLSDETFRATDGTVTARPIDWVSVKGKATPTLVYELLGLSDSADGALRRLAELHQLGLEYYRNREWSEAIACFAEVLQMRPGDGAATELLARSRTYLQNPPGPNWHGEHKMESK